MSQELSDAEWLRVLAVALLTKGYADASDNCARLRSIADKLERPAVEGRLWPSYHEDEDGPFVWWHVASIEHHELVASLGCEPKEAMLVRLTVTPAEHSVSPQRDPLPDPAKA